MLHLAALSFFNQDMNAVGVWFTMSIGAICLFGIFLPVSTWADGRRKERDAYYKAEAIRRIAESSGEGAKGAMELMALQSRLETHRRREGLKIGGLVTLCIGVALVIFLRSLMGPNSPYLCGLIPAGVGLALLTYVFFLAAPVE